MDLRGFVLATIRLGSRRDIFCCRTKIHKVVFLASQEFGLKFASFIPYHFGPWSPEVHNELRKLEDEKLLIQKASTRTAAGYTAKAYLLRLTKRGKAEARRAAARLPPEVYKYVEEWVKWDVFRLIGYVYVRYPYFASHSATADDELRPATATAPPARSF